MLNCWLTFCFPGHSYWFVDSFIHHLIVNFTYRVYCVTCTHTHARMCTHTHVRAHTDTHRHTLHTHAHIHAHTRTHTCTHTHAHTHTSSVVGEGEASSRTLMEVELCPLLLLSVSSLSWDATSSCKPAAGASLLLSYKAKHNHWCIVTITNMAWCLFIDAF